MSSRTAPFARARLMMAAIGAILAMPEMRNNVAARNSALAELGPYESRGKGCGGSQHSKRTIAQDKRDARNRKNHKRHL